MPIQGIISHHTRLIAWYHHAYINLKVLEYMDITLLWTAAQIENDSYLKLSDMDLEYNPILKTEIIFSYFDFPAIF